MDKGIESGVLPGTDSCDGCSPGPWTRGEGLSGSSANGAASSVGAEVASSDARSATGVGMEEKRSRKRRMVRFVVVVAVAAVDESGWRKVEEDQLESFPCPACKDHLRLGSYRVHRFRFEPGRTNCRERRRPALGSGRSSNQGCGVSEVRGRATSP